MADELRARVLGGSEIWHFGFERPDAGWDRAGSVIADSQ